MNEKQTVQSSLKETTNQPTDEILLQVGKVRPTKKQKELLAYIESFITEHGYSPSYREIMNGLQYNSVATVALHVGNLIKRGHVIKRDRSARSLEIVNHVPLEIGAKINDAKDSHEGWLTEKIEKLFNDVEKATSVSEKHQDDILVVFAALNILGLSEITQKLADRLKSLEEASRR